MQRLATCYLESRMSLLKTCLVYSTPDMGGLQGVCKALYTGYPKIPDN